MEDFFSTLVALLILGIILSYFFSVRRFLINYFGKGKYPVSVHIPEELILDNKELHEKLVDKYKNYNPKNISYPGVNQLTWVSPSILNK